MWEVDKLIGKLWKVYMDIATDEEIKKGKNRNPELARWIKEEEDYLHAQ